MNKIVHIGMDVGSTTVKIVVMDENLKEIYTSYERHYSDTKNTVCKVLEELVEKYKDKESVSYTHLTLPTILTV